MEQLEELSNEELVNSISERDKNNQLKPDLHRGYKQEILKRLNWKQAIIENIKNDDWCKSNPDISFFISVINKF
jgi:hypothetical protein